MKVSIVVPTYNRGAKLGDTLTSILANTLESFYQVEMIVVDDGSDPPASSVMESLPRRPRWLIRHLRQPNKGPAAARNAGFRAAHGSLVIFIDDDILTPPDLICKHVQAHQAHPNSVIFGRCPLKPDAETPLWRFLNSLGNDSGEDTKEAFVEAPIVASGQISVERSLFQDRGGVYRDDLSIPGAEEFELSYRLTKAGVPIFIATDIVALHNQPVALKAVCRQQYKYGLGLAEVAANCPALLEFEAFAHILSPWRQSSSTISLLQRLGRSLKGLLSRRSSRLALVRLVSLMERYVPIPRLLNLAYRAAIGAHWLAGIREGNRIYLND